ncbi:MAG: hypothetical protein ACYDHH_11750 [Solirubrobacteraceae bacterium]
MDDQPSRDREVSFTTIASELVELFENAPAMPLMHGRVRIDKLRVYRSVDALREALERDQADGRVEKAKGFDILMAADRLRDAVANAYPVPLTDQVRLRAQQAAELARALRIAAGLGPRNSTELS